MRFTLNWQVYVLGFRRPNPLLPTQLLCERGNLFFVFNFHSIHVLSEILLFLVEVCQGFPPPFLAHYFCLVANTQFGTVFQHTPYSVILFYRCPLKLKNFLPSKTFFHGWVFIHAPINCKNFSCTVGYTSTAPLFWCFLHFMMKRMPQLE